VLQGLDVLAPLLGGDLLAHFVHKGPKSFIFPEKYRKEENLSDPKDNTQKQAN